MNVPAAIRVRSHSIGFVEFAPSPKKLASLRRVCGVTRRCLRKFRRSRPVESFGSENFLGSENAFRNGGRICNHVCAKIASEMLFEFRFDGEQNLLAVDFELSGAPNRCAHFIVRNHARPLARTVHKAGAHGVIDGVCDAFEECFFGQNRNRGKSA